MARSLLGAVVGGLELLQSRMVLLAELLAEPVAIRDELWVNQLIELRELLPRWSRDIDDPRFRAGLASVDLALASQYDAAVSATRDELQRAVEAIEGMLALCIAPFQLEDLADWDTDSGVSLEEHIAWLEGKG